MKVFAYLTLLALLAVVSVDASGRYIVALKKSHARNSNRIRLDGILDRVFDGPLGTSSVSNVFDFGTGQFSGFAAKLTQEQIRLLEKSDEVDYIERDEIITMSGDYDIDELKQEFGDFFDDDDDITSYIPKSFKPRRNRKVIKKPDEQLEYEIADYDTLKYGKQNVVNNLFGIDSLDGNIDGVYHYPLNGGENVNAYVIDTGIDTDHPEFEGRATWGGSFVSREPQHVDGNGHGTHVAGTIGGKTYGVAKKVNLIAIRVLSSYGSGATSEIIAGMNFVSKAHREGGIPSVANMSLGGRGKSLNDAATALINAGIALAVAAGNDAKDACSVTPASTKSVLTVGAATRLYSMSYFSNFGSCVNIFAPGSQILSAKPNGETAVLSGTSMATPHVVGVLAVAYSYKKFDKPATAFNYIIEHASKDILHGIKDSPNVFLQQPPL